MARSRQQQLGADYERLAEEYLRSHDLKTVQRNYHCRYGELDLVMQHDDCLVVVEVRYRGPGARYDALASVTSAKQNRLALATSHFLKDKPGLRNTPVRFDVIAIDRNDAGVNATAGIQWLRDAFRPGY